MGATVTTETSEDLAQMQQIPAAVVRLSEVASADAVVGPAQERDGRTVIPLATVSAAFGLGMGYGRGDEDKGSGEGGGGGGGGRGGARPVAVIELTADTMRVHQVVDSTRITLASLALAAWCVFWITRTARAFRRR